MLLCRAACAMLKCCRMPGAHALLGYEIGGHATCARRATGTIFLNWNLGKGGSGPSSGLLCLPSQTPDMGPMRSTMYLGPQFSVSPAAAAADLKHDQIFYDLMDCGRYYMYLPPSVTDTRGRGMRYYNLQIRSDSFRRRYLRELVTYTLDTRMLRAEGQLLQQDLKMRSLS